jgi:hypothetical protein
MVQWNCTDYYLSEYSRGCCLNCRDARDGCLCKECKCKQCYWYTSPEDWDGKKGHCDKTDELKEQRKKELQEFYIQQEKEAFRKSEILRELNEKEDKRIRSEGKIPNTYTCQSCQRWFVIEQYCKIVPYQEPICPICKGEIK